MTIELSETLLWWIESLIVDAFKTSGAGIEPFARVLSYA